MPWLAELVARKGWNGRLCGGLRHVGADVRGSVETGPTRDLHLGLTLGTHTW